MKFVSLELDGVDFVVGKILDIIIFGVLKFVMIDVDFKIEDWEFD